jgi:HAD superfamily hydrolase (TIGR01484 family)
MGSYKLIALDMDGTLLDDEQKVSAENRKWINRAMDAGITVCLSTGRGIQSALPYAEELELQTPLVTVNGSEIWENPDVLLRRHLMDAPRIHQMQQLAVDHDIWYWAYSVEGIFNKDNWRPNLEEVEWLKFGFYTEDDEIRQAIHDKVSSWNVMEMTNSHPSNLECNPKGISKASGLHEVCQLLGIQMSEVVAMGDSLNDAAMIQAAGLGVAMGNAQPSIKEIADLVTETNQADGVAKAIRDHVLKC